MATIKQVEEIQAWQKARVLCKRVYSITNEGRFAKALGLRDQIRRAAISVMSNIEVARENLYSFWPFPKARQARFERSCTWRSTRITLTKSDLMN